MSPAPPTPRPKRLSIRMYQVGFGDCFLLSFLYGQPLADGRSERHVLIDFGSTGWPKEHRQRYGDIAKNIAARTQGRLDVVVVTHRHKDHIAGFGDATAGKILADLHPSLVLRPWTEDPGLAADAPRPRALGARSRSFAASLNAAQEFSADLADGLRSEKRGLRLGLAGLAFDQVANQAAIDRLDAMAAAAGGGRYLYAGQPSGIERLIPGVGVSVLGPPTPDQWPEVTGERANDPEYWIAHRALLQRVLTGAAPRRRAQADPHRVAVRPGPERWVIERMRDQEDHSLLRIVRTLDDAMNNTSLILLFKVGRRHLLFPGDAQIEDWSYTLKSGKAAKLRADLGKVDLYKVGHHGSRNASPKSLVHLWQQRATPLTSMMSTLSGVHGHSEATAVPQPKLTTALEALGQLSRTDTLAVDRLYLELATVTSRVEPFTETQG